MSAQSGNQHEHQVLQLATYEPQGTDSDCFWFYFRVMSSLRTFLQQDTVDIGRDRELIEQDPSNNELGDTESDGIPHTYIKLQHSRLPASGVLVHPERDVLRFHEAICNDEFLEALSEHYGGQQLGAIQNALFEEIQWNLIEDCLCKMRQFTGIRTIYVWLESYLNATGEPPSNEKSYLRRARRLRDRDEKVFAGRNVTVLYIDHERTI